MSKSNVSKVKTVRLNIKIDEDLRRRFVGIAKINGTTSTALLTKYIDDYVSQHNDLIEKFEVRD